MVASAPHGTKSVSVTTSLVAPKYTSNSAWGVGSGGRSLSATTASGGTLVHSIDKAPNDTSFLNRYLTLDGKLPSRVVKNSTLSERSDSD
jgi:hypothetical protein